MREDLLRHIWSKQLFDSTRLVTIDGRSLHILNPGTLHRGSGPDFRKAKVKIEETIFSGDIEFHRTFDDWKLHNHHNDPNYNSVILHVVLQGIAQETPAHSGRNIPTLILEPFLLTTVEKLSDQLSREEYLSKKGEIKCIRLNDSVDPGILKEWIRTLYRERLREKMFRLHERLCDIIITQQRIIGEPHPPYNELVDDIPLPDANIDEQLLKQKIAWEQLLYEEVMDGLGYSNNREPMKKLAENISLIQLIKICHADEGQHLSSQQIPKYRFTASRTAGQVRHNENIFKELSSIQIEAILFMASGLLPSLNEINDQDSKVHIHSLHSAWNELPKKIPLSQINHIEWIFSPTRPSNFPTIRIAAASAFLQKLLYQSLFKSIITLVSGKYSSPQSKIEQLLSLFDVGDHPFWNYHYLFTEATHKKHALIGKSRTFDIIVNMIVPFVCLYAKVFGKDDIFEHCLNIAVELPLLEDNSILRTMNKQLVKDKLKIEFGYQQQGLIQLHKHYCVVERCKECEIGKEVFTI
jgi:hypothetical protein